MRRTLIFLPLISLLSSCFLNREYRQWKSGKYPDEHFYKVLSINSTSDSTSFRTDRPYLMKADNKFYNYLEFSSDKRVCGSISRSNVLDTALNKSTCVVSGYWTVVDNRVIYESIYSINFFTGNNRKGIPLVFKHYYTYGLIKNDSLLISSKTFKTITKLNKDGQSAKLPYTVTR